MYWRDEWPVMEDGSQYDGKELLRLVRGGKSPFAKVWNVENLIQEIEEKLVTQVTEILIINKGSNNYVSLCLHLSSQYITSEEDAK